MLMNPYLLLVVGVVCAAIGGELFVANSWHGALGAGFYQYY